VAVEGLARELRREMLGIGLGSGIVTFANVHRRAESGRAVRLPQTSHHEICHLLGLEICRRQLLRESTLAVGNTAFASTPILPSRLRVDATFAAEPQPTGPVLFHLQRRDPELR
jgi:hypothetical protein